MESDKYRKLLLSLPALELSEQMPLHILARITETKRKNARVQLAEFTIIGVGSLVAIGPVVHLAIVQLSQSNFLQYLPIALEDKEVLAVAGKDMIFSLVESLPFTSITASLVVTFVFLYSLKLVVANTRVAFLITKPI